MWIAEKWEIHGSMMTSKRAEMMTLKRFMVNVKNMMFTVM